jgi:dihydroflavonol-4-reductase
MYIAVTGANGHVGINLCKSLLEKGHKVRVLKHKNNFALKNLEIEIFEGDLLNKESLSGFLSGIDVVYHLAAKISIKGDPDGSVQNLNVNGVRNLLELAFEAKVRKFIHFSSIHAFQQEPLNQVLDETRPLVDNDGFAYDKSKAAGESLVREAYAKGLDAVILSPTAIIGPADYEPSLIGKALVEIHQGQIPSLVPGGYNWIDVRDIVDAAINAIEKGRPGEKYLLAGQWRSLKDVSRLISEFTGKKTVKSEMPFWVAKVGLPFITLYSKISGAEPLYTSESLTIIMHGNKNISNKKAVRELGFSPRPLEETITDAMKWFRDNGYIH